MADLSGPVQQGIFAALSGAAPLAALVGARIYDAGAVPAVPTYPHVVLGPFTGTDAGDKGGDGDDGVAVAFAQTIDVWDRYDSSTGGGRGKKRSQAIMSAIHDALHEASLAVDGSPPAAQIIVNRVALVQLARDPDGLTMHGVVRVEGYAQP